MRRMKKTAALLAIASIVGAGALAGCNDSKGADASTPAGASTVANTAVQNTTTTAAVTSAPALAARRKHLIASKRAARNLGLRILEVRARTVIPRDVLRDGAILNRRLSVNAVDTAAKPLSPAIAVREAVAHDKPIQTRRAQHHDGVKRPRASART